MIIEDDRLIALIKSYLPQADQETCERIASELRGDAEAIIHSMVRRAVAQERQQLYRQQLKIS